MAAGSLWVLSASDRIAPTSSTAYRALGRYSRRTRNAGVGSNVTACTLASSAARTDGNAAATSVRTVASQALWQHPGVHLAVTAAQMPYKDAIKTGAME